MAGIGTIATTDDDDEENDNIPTILSIISFVLSIAVLAVAIMTWTSEEGQSFGTLFE